MKKQRLSPVLPDRTVLIWQSYCWKKDMRYTASSAGIPASLRIELIICMKMRSCAIRPFSCTTGI